MDTCVVSLVELSRGWPVVASSFLPAGRAPPFFTCSKNNLFRREMGGGGGRINGNNKATMATEQSHSSI